MYGTCKVASSLPRLSHRHQIGRALFPHLEEGTWNHWLGRPFFHSALHCPTLHLLLLTQQLLFPVSARRQTFTVLPPWLTCRYRVTIATLAGLPSCSPWVSYIQTDCVTLPYELLATIYYSAVNRYILSELRKVSSPITFFKIGGPSRTRTYTRRIMSTLLHL